GGGTAPPANLSTPGSHHLDGLGQGAAGARTLAKLGKTGTAAANWARASAPTVVRRPDGSPGAGRPRTGANPALAGGSALSGFTHILGGSDSGGLGAALPLLLILTLAATVGFAAGRRWRPRRA
ncbi:MAG: hypothetical protein ACRDKL_03345, partial [Solirubrobacteraceae bacterium]